MKVFVNQVPFEGVTLTEDLEASSLDLETEIIKFCGPLRIKANVSRITNAISALVTVSAKLSTSCCRCLEEINIDFSKEMKFNYPAEKNVQVIDLNPDIREEILLDYPMKPLCNPDCKGLCLNCGNKLNEGGCTCGST